MSDITFTAGLSAIPTKVEAALSEQILNELRKDGHGISFPDGSGCQMRFMVDGRNVGRFYSYKQCNGIAKAIALAMSRNKQLRIKRQTESWKHKKLVHFTSKFDKRRGKVEHSYGVNFTRAGIRAHKTFFIGYDDNVTADLIFHAYRTAMLFKWYYMTHGEGFNEAIFTNWKKVRVYDGFTPFEATY